MSRSKRPGFLELEREACTRLGAPPLPPLIVVTGDEPFLKERLLDTIRHAAEGGVEIFVPRPEESEPAAYRRLLDMWTTATLFERGNVLLARGVDALLKHPELPATLDGPLPPHHLVLTATALDGRSKLARTLKAGNGLVAFPPLRDAPPPWQVGGATADTELNQWVVAEGRHRGVGLELATADALTRRLGNEPAALARKLDQLVILTGGAKTITGRDVARHVRHTSARLLSLYEDSLRTGRLSEALTLLDRMSAEGVYDHNMRLVSGAEAADTVLRGLAANLARVLTAHEQLGPELHQALGAKPWQRSKAAAAALDAVLGSGGRRVFLERDLRTTRRAGVASAFALTVAGLRALRDGRGLSLHATTVRLVAALSADDGRAA